MDPVYSAVYLAAVRLVFPFLGFWILLRCGSDLIKGRCRSGRNVVTLLLVTAYQGLNGFGFWLVGERMAALCYGAITVLQWTMLLAYAAAGKPGFSLESLVFFLCSVGLGAVAEVRPAEVPKQMMAVAVGVATYVLVCWLRADERRNRKAGYGAAVLGLLLPVLTLIMGREYYGAKSWVVIGPMSIQPSELGKLCLVYAGATFLTMEKKGLLLLLPYGAAVCVCLIWMNDFGAAAVYFAALMTMIFLHSGFAAAAGLAAVGVGFATWRMPAYAWRRFAVWRHIWEQPVAGGYQQTRGLQCIAAGGMFGLGFGKGHMGRIFAADSDMVFAAVCEIWGILVGVLPIIGLGLLVIYAVKNTGQTDGFSAICGCGAAALLAVQGALNVLGTVDLLPMTGVTLPFVSNGGTAMVAAWGLAALIKVMETERR